MEGFKLTIWSCKFQFHVYGFDNVTSTVDLFGDARDAGNVHFPRILPRCDLGSVLNYIELMIVDYSLNLNRVYRERLIETLLDHHLIRSPPGLDEERARRDAGAASSRCYCAEDLANAAMIVQFYIAVDVRLRLTLECNGDHWQ